MVKLAPGWYILLYHEVSWEENPLLRSVSGMVVSPDLLNDQLKCLTDVGTFLSPEEGLKKFSATEPDQPYFSLWFDDGYAGVRRYALPRIKEYGVTAAISVCSRFVLRQEFYWRLQLGWLASTDGMRFFRTQLRKKKVRVQGLIRDLTMDQFSPELRDWVDQAWQKYVPEEVSEDAFRMFETLEGLKSMQQQEGWQIANHSASHYPIGERGCLDQLVEQFEQCTEECQEHGLKLSNDWVLPFDRDRDPNLESTFYNQTKGKRLVLLGNRPNYQQNIQDSILYRHVVPPCRGEQLLKRLRGNH